MKRSKTNLFFLPYPFKFVGYILILVGIIWWFLSQYLAIVIKIPVLAIVSSYISTNFFSIIQTNISDEISLITLLLGCIASVFSREKIESPEIDRLRFHSLFLALFINLLILLFSSIFFYGSAFALVILTNIISLSVIYLIIFRIKIFKLRATIS